LKQCRNPQELEAKIAKSRDIINKRKSGYIIVGQVVLDGPGNVRDVKSQMEILDEGYFAGPIKDLFRPVGFRMHGYAPYDLQLKNIKEDEKQDWIDVGIIHMKPLKESQLANLKGQIALKEGGNLSEAQMVLNVSNGPVNTPSNGTEPRSYWPDPIKISVQENGSAQASGFSPINYWCRVTAKDYLAKRFNIDFNEGQTLDLGTIILEKPTQIELTYLVSEKPPFDPDKLKTTSIPAGTRWKATYDIYGWDLEFTQKESRVSMRYSYAPCYLWDLGDGKIGQYVDVDIDVLGQKLGRNPHVDNGHVYLMHQQHWKRWVLFKIFVN
jgi:hypothetical protein